MSVHPDALSMPLIPLQSGDGRHGEDSFTFWQAVLRTLSNFVLRSAP
jgi:hypothetical protein